MPNHKSEDFKLSAVKYYLEHSNNQTQTCQRIRDAYEIFGFSVRSLMRWVDKYNTLEIKRKTRKYVAYQ
mgnify:CR=1 FL=1